MSVSPTALELHRQHLARIKKWEVLAAAANKPLPPAPEPPPPPRPLSAEELRIWKTLAEGLAPPPAPDLTSILIVDIQRAVCRYFNMGMSDLLSARRAADVVWPRQIAMYISKTLTMRSLPDIGRRFGGRDHTTVLHAVRKVEQLRGEDAKINGVIESINKKLAHTGK